MAESLSAKFEKSCKPVVPHVHWLVRFALAGIFIYHGQQKIRGGTPPAEVLDMMFFGSGLLFWLVAIGELAAGIGILFGGLKHKLSDLATRVSGLTIAIIMLGAALTFHLPAWNFMEGGAEFQTLTAMLGLYFAVRGNA